jgi:hypothetical protein
MNRKVRPFRATKAERSKPSETITIQVMSISGNAPECRISYCLRVQKGSFVSIKFRDGARISDRLVENMIPKHFPILTSNY